jgi:hypothetical protein
VATIALGRGQRALRAGPIGTGPGLCSIPHSQLAPQDVVSPGPIATLSCSRTRSADWRAVLGSRPYGRRTELPSSLPTPASLRLALQLCQGRAVSHSPPRISIQSCSKVHGAGPKAWVLALQFWPSRTEAMQDSVYELPRIHLIGTRVNKVKKRKYLGSSHQKELYHQPDISADTAKYSTSAHEPRSATPASHITPNTNTVGISKNRS